MADALTKLRELLRELFQLDNADLDFGIYRIMNLRRTEITRFLDNDLLPQVKEAFKQYQSSDSAQLTQDLNKVIQQLKDAGVDPDTAPKVKQLRDQLSAAVDVAALEQQVFSDLYAFFRRYYSEGDFLSLRRYKAGVYAIPYEGEEVKLHWTNHDQYFIKSTEYFRDYTFTLAAGKRVHFKLIDADTEKDNNKPVTGSDRRFILVEDVPVNVVDGELLVRFEYRQDVEKRKQSELSELAEKRILQLAPDEWAHLLVALRSESPSDPKPTVLRHRLKQYTARNTFDYFIHKDLGGFLRRELDFYIKNEVMHLDDIESAEVPRVEQYLSRIKVLRAIAHKIIAFVAQIENFQKRLWLKKKFVVDTHWLVSVDRISDRLRKVVAKNANQWSQWEALGFKPTEQTLGMGDWNTRAHLDSNPGLVVDTSLFDREFVDSLLASEEVLDGQSTLDDATTGVLFDSENFQALNLMQERYHKNIDCTYIDPPYNTGEDEFSYKDGFQHSSWLSLIENRTLLSSELLSDRGVFLCSLDDTEDGGLRYLMSMDTRVHRLGEFVWKTRNTDNRIVTKFSLDHEQIHVYAVNAIAGRVIDRSSYINPDKDIRGPYTTDPLTGKANFIDRPNLHYVITNHETGDVYKPDPDFGWITDPDGFAALVADNRVAWPENTLTGRPRKKRFAEEMGDRAPASSLGLAITQGEGNDALIDLFGRKPFTFPKPPSILAKAIDWSVGLTGNVLDCFAGSGTTAHAIMNLNREDGGHRRFVLVEMGEHFRSVLKPRVMKVMYSPEWSNGRAITYGKGLNGLVKVLRLEGYEDTLGNLHLTQTRDQDLLLQQHAKVREEYTLGYLLETESRGSASLLNTDRFNNPFDYKLDVSTGTAGETESTAVDLVETFNWLLGLRVATIDTIKGIRVVTGTNPQGEKVLILWRRVADLPNKELDAWLFSQKVNPRDMEFDLIYVNGDNNLENLKKENEAWKVRLIEEEFQRLMFDVQDV